MGKHFIPYFQPQFDAVTHDLVGIEALARWSHPMRGASVQALSSGPRRKSR